jgi:hypothetical protein
MAAVTPPLPAPPPPRRAFLARLGLVLALALAGAGAGLAAGAPVPEYNLKAGYLLLFTRYVNWPEKSFRAADAPIVIGVLGDNPFGDVLELTVRGQRSQDRPIVVRPVRTVAEAAGCHIVFIARRQAQEEQWLRELSGQPVLTVTESARGLEYGAVLSLSLEESARGTRVAFSASLPAARAGQLQLSASMLASARKVLRADPPPPDRS